MGGVGLVAALSAGLLDRGRRIVRDGAGSGHARRDSSCIIAMRRLYRTRNIILHGGATHGVALEASLRTAAPLLGVGLDRIVYASYTEDLDPPDLAARAEVALQLVHGETGLTTVDLLEPAR
ncbi:hypothetical protein [Streptomyces sp. NPDC012756]|uniref:hypothetical protein n=1 Tax=Streptomyces sp. NPDC012756 TaxID=3364847 RepID=UPI0036BB01F8